MAKHVGKNGVIKVGSNAVANVQNFTLDETAPTIEQIVMGDTFGSGAAGIPRATGSFQVLWDPSDTNGQNALTVGAAVTLNIYPDGTATNDYYQTVACEITGRSVASEVEGNVQRTYSFVATADPSTENQV